MNSPIVYFDLNQEDELKVEIQTGEKIGINGTEYSVLSNACVSMYDVPVANQYLIYYPANAQLSGNNLDYSLPTVQTYTQGAIDQSACPLYCLTDNDGLNNMKMNAACGGLKLIVPANEDFASLTSVTFESKTIACGDVRVDATTGQVTFLENTSKTLMLKGRYKHIRRSGTVSCPSADGIEQYVGYNTCFS